MKTPEKSMRVVKIKTIDKLLSSGWEYDSRGELHHEDYEDKDTEYYFTFAMLDFTGKVIPLKQESYFPNQWIYIDDNKNKWTISEEMISKELSPEDYPEFFI